MRENAEKEEKPPREVLTLLTAAERARHDLVTEEGMMAVHGTAPVKTFKINHRKTVRAINRALEPFAGQYRPTGDP